MVHLSFASLPCWLTIVLLGCASAEQATPSVTDDMTRGSAKDVHLPLDAMAPDTSEFDATAACEKLPMTPACPKQPYLAGQFVALAAQGEQLDALSWKAVGHVKLISTAGKPTSFTSAEPTAGTGSICARLSASPPSCPWQCRDVQFVEPDLSVSLSSACSQTTLKVVALQVEASSPCDPQVSSWATCAHHNRSAACRPVIVLDGNHVDALINVDEPLGLAVWSANSVTSCKLTLDVFSFGALIAEQQVELTSSANSLTMLAHLRRPSTNALATLSMCPIHSSRPCSKAPACCPGF